MRIPVSLGLVSLFIGLTAITLSGEQNHGAREIRDRFVGAWRLAWLEEKGADGNIHRADCTGQLVYTRDGHMSVQVMYRNFQDDSQGDNQPAKRVAPVQYAKGGYEASFGTYEVDERAHTFNYHVEGALVRTLVGKDLPRSFEFSGSQLIVKSTHPEEHWRVAWEHE